MAFAIFEPAALAALLLGGPHPPPTVPVPAIPAMPASPCGGRAAAAPAFDCCLDLALWKAPPTAPLNLPAPPPDTAADQKEGR